MNWSDSTAHLWGNSASYTSDPNNTGIDHGSIETIHSPTGIWLNTENNFIGLKIITHSDTIYSWIKINRSYQDPTDNALTLLEYAY